MANPSPEILELMLGYASHIRSDEANTDEFMTEGMTFQDCIDLMDHVAKAIVRYVEEESKNV